MIFFKKEPTPGTFIQKPVYHYKQLYVSDITELIYFPPLRDEFFEKLQLGPIDDKLYRTLVGLVQNMINQLYHIPAARQFFGDDLLHGLSIKHNRAEHCLEFVNIDSTEQCDILLRELTKALAISINTFLETNDYFVMYLGEQIQIIDRPTLYKQKKAFIEDRVIWF